MRKFLFAISGLALTTTALGMPLPKEFEHYASAPSMVQHIKIHSWSDQEFTGETKVDIYFDRAIGFQIGRAHV